MTYDIHALSKYFNIVLAPPIKVYEIVKNARSRTRSNVNDTPRFRILAFFDNKAIFFSITLDRSSVV